MPISDDYTIDYPNLSIETNISFSSGKPSTIYSMREFYRFIKDTWDEPAQMDEEISMTAQTPNEYTLTNGWHITERAVQTLFGGSLQTNEWLRNSTNAGIVIVDYSGTTHPTTADLGAAVGSTDSDAGILLDFSTVRGVMWIRPDSTAAANDFNSSAGNLDIGTTQYPQTVTTRVTGETVWRNFFSLGTIEAQTELYVIQTDEFFDTTASTKALITAWWDEDVDFTDPTGSGGATSGQFDILLKIREADALLDDGHVEVMGRQYSKLYDFFALNTTLAGRSPVPLSIGDDLNNTTGVRQFDSTATTGAAFTSNDVDTVIASTVDADNTAVITNVTTGTTTPTVDYYLIGNLTDFGVSTVLVREGTTADKITVSATTGPRNIGASTLTSAVTVTFGNSSAIDIDADGTNENYSVVIDLNGNTVQAMYENLKFRTGRGSSEDIDAGAQTIRGDAYTGVGNVRFEYDAQGTSAVSTLFLAEGDLVHVNGSTAITAVVTAIEDTGGGSSGHLTLRDTRGTFANNNIVESVTNSSRSVTLTSTSRTPPIVKGMPFGSFAGGVFFGAEGVGLSSVAAADAQNFQTINTSGETVIPPNIVSVTVSNLLQEDRIAIYRLTGGTGTSINKSTYTVSSAVTSGVSTIGVTVAIDSFYPSTGGTLKVVTTQGREDRYSYASFATSIFTLSTFTTGVSTVADSSGKTLTDNQATFITTNIEPGMIIKNQATSAIAEILEIVSSFVLEHTAFSNTTLGSSNNWAIGDGYEINRTVEAYTSQATLYPSVMDVVISTATGTTLNTESITFASTFLVTVRVRAGSTGSKIQPFVTEGEVTSGGLSVRAVRTADDIAST